MAPKNLDCNNEFVQEYLYLEDYNWYSPSAHVSSREAEIQQYGSEKVERGVIVIDLLGE